jgi:hypothetical protein
MDSVGELDRLARSFARHLRADNKSPKTVLPATLFAHGPATFRDHGSASLCDHGGPLTHTGATVSPG